MLETLVFLIASGIGTYLGWSSAARAVWTAKRGVLLAMAGVAAAFWVALTIGFRLHQTPAPRGMDAGLVPAVIVLSLTVTIGVRLAWRSWGNGMRSFSTERLVRSRSNPMADRNVWLTAMAADPLRRRYAAMIEAGDVFWTPARIEYDLDPQATACCQHLSPIESAMRVAGVRVRLNAVGSVRAECLIDRDALAQRLPFANSVSYQELQAYDRSVEDPPQAVLDCALCGSRLWVRHPRECGSTTPAFPAT